MRTAFLAWVATGTLTATGLGVMIKRYFSRIVNAIGVARVALDLLDDIIEAAQDNQFTQAEIEKVSAQVLKLKTQLDGKK